MTLFLFRRALFVFALYLQARIGCQGDAVSLKEMFARDPVERITNRGRSSSSLSLGLGETPHVDILESVLDQTRSLNEVLCAPYPSVVKVYEDGDSSAPETHKPEYVMLHRCAGGCGQDFRECTPTSKVQIPTVIYDLDNRVSLTATVTNHTKCVCICKKFQRCGANKMWVPNNCRCE